MWRPISRSQRLNHALWRSCSGMRRPSSNLWRRTAGMQRPDAGMWRSDAGRWRLIDIFARGFCSSVLWLQFLFDDWLSDSSARLAMRFALSRIAIDAVAARASGKDHAVCSAAWVDEDCAKKNLEHFCRDFYLMRGFIQFRVDKNLVKHGCVFVEMFFCAGRHRACAMCGFARLTCKGATSCLSDFFQGATRICSHGR